jgi:hypothetical protein
MTQSHFLILIATIYVAPHATSRFAYVVAFACFCGIAALELGASA